MVLKVWKKTSKFLAILSHLLQQPWIQRKQDEQSFNLFFPFHYITLQRAEPGQWDLHYSTLLSTGKSLDPIWAPENSLKNQLLLMDVHHDKDPKVSSFSWQTLLFVFFPHFPETFGFFWYSILCFLLWIGETGMEILLPKNWM